MPLRVAAFSLVRWSGKNLLSSVTSLRLWSICKSNRDRRYQRDWFPDPAWGLNSDYRTSNPPVPTLSLMYRLQ